jgi:hypothetical protein
MAVAGREADFSTSLRFGRNDGEECRERSGFLHFASVEMTSYGGVQDEAMDHCRLI